MLRIDGDEIYLASLNNDHATENYVEWLNDKAINQYLETRHVQQDLNSIRSFIESCNGDSSIVLLGIFTKEGKHVGNIKSGPIDNKNKKTDIGIMIGDKSIWGKGIASEAIYLLTDYLFSERGINKIEAGCYESNVGSKKAFEKNGYLVEGLKRETFFLENRFEGCWFLGIKKNEFKKK